MPKSRKRQKRTPNLVRRARNHVRGARYPSSAFIYAYQQIPANEKSSFIGWAEKVQFGDHRPLANPFPQTFAAILRQFVPIRTDFDAVLEILSKRVILHSEKIGLFVSNSQKLQNEFLISNFEECIATIETIEKSLGASLWVMEAKVALLSLIGGLAAQKEFTNAIRASAPHAVTKSFAYFVSQRNEPSTSPFRYVIRLRDLLNSSKLNDSSKLHYQYRLIGSTDLDQESIETILLSESTSSLLDVYDSFINISLNYSALGFGIASNKIIDTISDMEIIGDERTKKILTLNGRIDGSSLRSRRLEPDNALLRGQLGQTFLEKEKIREDPRSIWIDAVIHALIGRTRENPSNFSEENSVYLTSILMNDSNSVESVAKVAGNGLNLNFSYCSTFIFSIANDLANDEPPFNRALYCKSALHSPYLDPWDLLSIDCSLQSSYQRLLQDRYGRNIVIDFVCWLLGDEVADAPTGISSEFRRLGEVYRSFSQEKFSEAANLAVDLGKIPAFKTLAARWRSHALLTINMNEEFITFAAELFVEDASLYRYIPVDLWFAGKKWRDLLPCSDKISLSILIDFHSRRIISSELNSYKRYAVEDYLVAVGVQKPSELRPALAQVAVPLLIYFLSSVCTTNVLDLMLEFPSSRSVFEERRDICARLVEIDPNNAETYREEIAQITQMLRLEEGRRLLDQSRVYVDEEALILWSDREIKEGYDRYRALDEVGIGFDRIEFSAAMHTFFARKEILPIQFMKLPKGEADELLLEVISKLRDAFLKNPSFGLDAYLSLRVRHGTLSGMLRGPLETNHVIFQRLSGTNRYEVSNYWASTLVDIPSDQMRSVERAISRFSLLYDQQIDELRNRLQIQDKENPKGFFDIELNAIHVYILKSWITTDTSLEEFVRSSNDLFWILLEDSLKNVKQFIEHDMRDSLAALFEELEAEILQAPRGSRYGLLTDSVRQALTDAQTVLVNLASWFQRNTTSEYSTYPIELAVDIAIEVVKTTYQNFSPIIEKKIRSKVSVGTGSVTVISDIIFTALDNVYQHSGMPNNPKIGIEIYNVEDNRLCIEVKNELSDSFDYEKSNKKIADIISKIDRHEYKTKMTSGEGGTGLLKLKAFVDPGGERLDALRFGILDDKTFEVAVVLATYRSGQ